MFWLCVTAMILVALFITLFPHRRRGEDTGSDSDEAVLAVYKQNLADLQSDIKNGTLDEEQAGIAKLELEHGLLGEVQGGKSNQAQTVTKTSLSRDWLLNGFIVLLLPIFAISLYYKLGQPQLASGIITPANNATALTNDEEQPSVEELVLGLEQRLQQTPEDAKGWWMLTRTYMALGRYEDALQSVERLYQLAGDQADILLLYANVLIVNNKGSFTGKPLMLIQQALALEPENTGGLWLAGLAAEEQADYEGAIVYFQKLHPLVKEDETANQQVEQMLAQWQEAQTGESTAGESLDKGKAEPVHTKDLVIVNVSLSPELVAQTDPNDTLFVFARAEDGMPMPVAVNRMRVADLPASVVLSDDQAMMPSRLLSKFKEVQVMARISKSGNAIAQSGDLSSDVQSIEVGATVAADLQINQVVP
ncbi:MAG: cytochrome c-type biogenesis protein CcmH [Gammaproteobacteria bacterium]|jgi:cytochrome c-type biogenesis protein CcmH